MALTVALDVAEAEREMLDASTHFGEVLDDRADADRQTRFLRAIGRSA